MTLSLIAAVAENRAIGRGGALPWRLPDDLRHFRRVTTGHPVVMGRKTYESIGKPLPGRRNIVVTRDPGYPAPGCTVVNSLEAALEAAGDAAEVFVIGGAELYALALPLAERLHLTQVHARVEGDAFFPEFDEAEWDERSAEHHPADEHHAHAFTIRLLERKKQQ